MTTKCTRCGATVRPPEHRCRRCGNPVKWPSDDMVRKMTVSPRLALACGSLLLVTALLLFWYGTEEFAVVLLFLGIPLALVGLFMG